MKFADSLYACFFVSELHLPNLNTNILEASGGPSRAARPLVCMSQ